MNEPECWGCSCKFSYCIKPIAAVALRDGKTIRYFCSPRCLLNWFCDYCLIHFAEKDIKQTLKLAKKAIEKYGRGNNDSN